MTEKQIPYGYVYRITNKINHKTYIGQRKLSLDTNWRQYMGSGVLIKQAILKYGKNSFIKTLLKIAYSKKELDEYEWELIQTEKDNGKGEYNLFNGKGAGGDTFSELSNKTKEDFLKKRSEKVKESFKNGTLTVWNKGQTKETSLILKAKSERAISSGTYKNIRKEYSHSEETKTKLSESSRGNKNSQSNKNMDKRAALAVKTMFKQAFKDGKNNIQKHDEMLSSDLLSLRDVMTRKEIAAKFFVSTTYLDCLLRKHGFIKEPKSKDKTPCLLCYYRMNIGEC